MRGKVTFWKRDFNNPKNELFGWGFIQPENTSASKAERVYFNETRLPEGIEVRAGDLVEFTLFKPSARYPAKAAIKVEKINDEDQTKTPRSLHQTRREKITVIPGELEANFD